MKKISIYIAGSVRKDANDENNVFASDDIKDELIKSLSDFKVIIFDPNESKIFGDDSISRFGKDCLQVVSSNFLVIDLREKRGLGVGAEMMLAKEKGIPVIAVCPSESHYKRNMTFHNGTVSPKWVHPFVGALSDGIVENFSEAGEWIRDFIKNPFKVRSGKIIDQAIKEYLDIFLDKDSEFKEKYLDSLIDKLA